MTRYLWIGHKLAHRVIMERIIGRLLLTNEIVHHINGEDNRLENLEMKMISQHSRYHALQHPAEIIEIPCTYCGKIFYRRKKKYEWEKSHGHIIEYCSKSCKGKGDTPSRNGWFKQKISPILPQYL